MAVRRKYVSAAVADAPIEPPMPVAAQAAPPAAPLPPPGGDAGNELQRALAAQQHAEALQRQQQPQSVEQYIDRLPDLSDHKRDFLKKFPVLLDPTIAPVMARIWRAGLDAGLQDDTPELDNFVVDNVAREVQHHQKLTSAQARSTPENAQRHHEVGMAVEDLNSEAEALLGEALAAHEPAAPPAAPRRSVPFSAPVSREVPMATGGRRQSENTLTPEERVIARTSFSAPNMSNTEKEYLYLQNRKKMQAMKADGRIQGDR
ncbi:hypothetical protein V1283_003774 [Bradyrhizobium sp. AZCC 2262]|uniref:hypothetical protein n=1 Tax=Bradyrhizobium sp. AZCC 2262 TaxID=3117022 RepID=UPI002FEFDE81